MALTKITKADLDAAIKKLTTSDATVWWKVLATTDEGTDLCFVVGWEYYDDEDDRFYQDKGYTICAKIGYKPHNLMVMDYDDIYMPFDKKTGDVWDTDSAVDKDPSCWDMLVRNYNSEASAIWRKYGKPNRDGMTALDLMESKKKESKKHTCSMQKKKESLAKKTEMVRPEDPDELKVGKYTADVLTADGDFILSLPAFYDDVAETVKAAKDYLQEESDYVKDTGLVPSKIHVTTVVAKRGWNMPQFVKDVDLNATEAKKPACSMQKKIESLKITEATRKYYNTEDWWKRLQDDYNDMYDGLGFEFKFNGPEKMADIYSNGKKWGSISWKGLYKLLDEDGKWLYKSPAPAFRDFLYYLAKYQGEDLNKHYNGTIAKRSW